MRLDKLLRQVLDDQRLKEIILESIPSGLITTDRTGHIVTFNRAAQAILGYHPREVLGQPLHKFIDLHPGQPNNRLRLSVTVSPLTELQGALHTVLPVAEVQSGTVIAVDRQGHEVVLDVDVLPLCDESGAQVGALATFTDITSVHHLEEEKRRLDRLVSLGEMAANVAHEVRNPLASIKTSMQMLRDDLICTCTEESSAQVSLTRNGTQTDWAQESISVVLKEVERLDTIVRDLLLFAKPRQLHRIKCSLIELSDRVLQFIQPQCAEANVVIRTVYEEVPLLLVDLAQMEQVLLNLYMNALQAMPDGGILTISCHVISADTATCGIEDDESMRSQALSTQLPLRMGKTEPLVQQWLEMSVSDTGVGIASDQLKRIFQPFFTTKAHGIGLGLAITRRLVEDHGGYIRVESHFGYGAVISIRLPLLTGDITHTHYHDESESE